MDNYTTPHSVYHIGRDTDSEGSLDMELAQDLSRRSEKDGKDLFRLKFQKLHCKTFNHVVKITINDL